MATLYQDARIDALVAEQPYPLLFVTISGAHLYGFPSPDSDFDLRGVHLLPLQEVVGLLPGRETVQDMTVRDGVEMDVVSHDAKKFFSMLLKRNGYVLEQLYSPLVVRTSPAHEELKEIAQRCITRHHAHHYMGFAATQWKLFAKEQPPRVKPLLYTFRVLLTGIHLMRTGEVEANMVTLNETFKLPYLPELVARKREGAEKGKLEHAELDVYAQEYQRLLAQLEEAHQLSDLPDAPSGHEELNDLLVRLRLSERSAR
jgi:hypothetical protein